MNKRLADLEAAAYVEEIQYEEVSSRPPREYQAKVFSREKFAELIVRETLDLLQKEWYSLNNAPKFEDGESQRDVGIRVGRKSEIISLIAEINKHFGVE